MAELNAWLTFSCSALSLSGSLFVLCSYLIARTKSRPKAAQLIRNLALTDFAWFLSALLESSFWILHQHVPTGLCYVLSPVVNFTRMASLIWTCAISFDVLMSVTKRKWLWSSEENGWSRFRCYYYGGIIALALPGALLNLIKQHTAHGKHNLGCNAGYESLGQWYEIFCTEIVPILIGFTFNVFVYFRVRNRMATKAYPQSVRKRRRRIMYHYIIVCILCWIPTIIFYVLSILGLETGFLEIFARLTLYLTGFFNFLVFGMQDPHLKKSAEVILHIFTICCRLGDSEPSAHDSSLLKSQDVVKSVMFEESTIVKNADFSKDKRFIYRHHRLSKEDKEYLYQNRPDLQPQSPSSSFSANDDSAGNKVVVTEIIVCPEMDRDSITSISTASTTSSNSSTSSYSRADSREEGVVKDAGFRPVEPMVLMTTDHPDFKGMHANQGVVSNRARSTSLKKITLPDPSSKNISFSPSNKVSTASEYENGYSLSSSTSTTCSSSSSPSAIAVVEPKLSKDVSLVGTSHRPANDASATLISTDIFTPLLADSKDDISNPTMNPRNREKSNEVASNVDSHATDLDSNSNRLSRTGRNSRNSSNSNSGLISPLLSVFIPKDKSLGSPGSELTANGLKEDEGIADSSSRSPLIKTERSPYAVERSFFRSTTNDDEDSSSEDERDDEDDELQRPVKDSIMMYRGNSMA